MDNDSKGWKVYRKEWYNDRVMETYINSPIIDKQNDLIPTEVLEESMDFYMKYGVYSYQHEEIPIGLPLAYKIDDGKIKVKYGIHNQLEMHHNVWKEIKDFGTKGASSIRGETLSQDMVCPDGADTCFNKINDLGLWSVSWVGDNPANIEATVTDVALAKADDPKTPAKTLLVKAPKGHHWMAYKDGPVLMVGEYAPHEGAVEVFEFEVIEEHDDSRLAKADKANNFINETNKIAIMAKKDDDCGCSTEKAEETETTEVVEEVKSEEVTVEVISPEELPDVVEEEEAEKMEEEEEKELSLEYLAEEMKAMQAKLDEMTEPKMEEEEKEEEEEAEKSETETEADPSLEVVMKSLKKYGISVYAGSKVTPVSANDSPKAESFDWNNVSKTWDELEDTIGDN